MVLNKSLCSSNSLKHLLEAILKNKAVFIYLKAYNEWTVYLNYGCPFIYDRNTFKFYWVLLVYQALTALLLYSHLILSTREVLLLYNKGIEKLSSLTKFAYVVLGQNLNSSFYSTAHPLPNMLYCISLYLLTKDGKPCQPEEWWCRYLQRGCLHRILGFWSRPRLQGQCLGIWCEPCSRMIIPVVGMGDGKPSWNMAHESHWDFSVLSGTAGFCRVISEGCI